MKQLSLGEIAKLSNGTLNNKKFSNLLVSEISIDTRTLKKGDMYMPIIGERFDGHNFIKNAFDKEAIATFSEKNKFEDNSKPIIWVKNTNQAFIDFSKNYKNNLDIKIIAITGSNGKTTTKDLISSVLEEKYSTKKTIGNLNNHIGVPKTLLRFDDNTNIGVVELGTDGFGQIEVLSNMVNPDIAIITNIGDTHLEQLKTKENIAKEKLHIIDGLNKDGVLIYNNDDEILRTLILSRNLNCKTISFGTRKDSDYIIDIIESNNDGAVFKLNNIIYTISLIGTHQIYNAAVAIIVSKLFNIDTNIAIKGLNKNEITKMRTELLNCDGFDILNDSYKSNPQSLKSALDTLNILNGYSKKIAILGDMLELGSNEIELHKEIGKHIYPNNVDYLLLYGPLSKYIAEEAQKNYKDGHVFFFDKKEDLIDKAKYLITKNSIVLVKASRSLRLEEIVEELEKIHLS